MTGGIVNDPGPARPVNLLLAGDLILDLPDADHWLSGIAPAIRAADVAIGNLEVPHSRSTVELRGDVPAPGAPPENLDAIARAGFTALSLGGNHMADCGAQGIADTMSGLDRLGIAYAGAGMTLVEARAPALIEAHGRQIALLSYNCVGPEAAWATGSTAGTAYLRVGTADGSPIAPAADLVEMTDDARAILVGDIRAARRVADLVVVALHKGLVHRPASLAPYERPIAHAAIEAGADIVAGHHAHIVQGIEFHQGKPIFHGLGNGCVVTDALSPDQDHEVRAEWARRRKALFGFEPDPAYVYAPFHPEAINAMLGQVLWHPDGRLETRIVPVHVEAPGRPVLAEGRRADEIIAYLERITTASGLPAVSLERARVAA